MSIISIGIQTIMPKTATTPQPPPPQPANDLSADVAPVAVKQAPPPEGMGKFVDKTV
jgi:hypothetical protein